MLPMIRNRTPSLVGGFPELRFDMDRLFGDLLSRRTLDWDRAVPAADLFETDDEFVVEMDLPGFAKDEVDVTVEQGVLTVSGEHKTDSDKDGQTFHLRERVTNQFTRSFSVPQSIEAGKVAAKFDNGVLRVTLPKAPEAKARRIEVSVK